MPKLARISLLVSLSVGGGLVAAGAYAASIGPNGGIKTLALPAVAEITLFFGILAGLLIAPLMVWALKDRNLWIAVPSLYGLGILVIVSLNKLSVSFSEIIAIVVVVLALLFYGVLGKRHDHAGNL